MGHEPPSRRGVFLAPFLVEIYLTSPIDSVLSRAYNAIPGTNGFEWDILFFAPKSRKKSAGIGDEKNILKIKFSKIKLRKSSLSTR